MTRVSGPPSTPDLERYALDSMILARARRPLGHEMKNAVQALYSGIEILAKVIEPGSKSKVSAGECVALLRRQLDGLQQRLAHILDDVAPVHAGPQTFDVCALIQDVSRFLTSDAAVAGVRLQLEIPEQCSVEGRPATIRRLLLGYFFDAIDTIRGGTLNVSLTQDGERACIELRNIPVTTPAPQVAQSVASALDGAYLRRLTRSLLTEDGGDCSFDTSPAENRTRIFLKATR